MQSWNLLELEMPEGSRSPIVLHSHDEARAVLTIAPRPSRALRERVDRRATRVSARARSGADAGVAERWRTGPHGGVGYGSLPD